MKNYAVKIKSTQEMQENYTGEKQKYTNTSDASHASGPCMAKRKNRIDAMLDACIASRTCAACIALCALCAFEWKPGLSVCLSVCLFVCACLCVCAGVSLCLVCAPLCCCLSL